jgi:hypothetical protein
VQPTSPLNLGRDNVKIILAMAAGRPGTWYHGVLNDVDEIARRCIQYSQGAY